MSDATTQAMDYLSDLIPYKMPEVQPSGDIVIRRDKPTPDPAAEAMPLASVPANPGSGSGS